MANLENAKKAIRSSAKKAARNQVRKDAYKTARKNVLKAVEAGDKKKANELMPAAVKAIDKAAKGSSPLHQKTAARYKSRLAAKVAAMK